MPLRLGLLVYPLFVGAVALSKKGVVSKFVQANATAPERARKPASLEIRDVDAVKSAARRGTLIALGDGRYYANLPKIRRNNRLFWSMVVAGGLVTAALAAIAYWPT
jgi:hypothetical protein